jgi:O-methyltransferase
MLKQLVRRIARYFGYEIRSLASLQPRPVTIPAILDGDLYRPLFSPWFGNGGFRQYYDRAAARTIVSADRCWILYSLARQATHLPGDFWECGVYRGGTAALLKSVLETSHSPQKLFLFDTFEGMPETSPVEDLHKQGDFADTSLQAVREFLGPESTCVFRPGLIPHSFAGLEDCKIAFAHVDVDIYHAILDSVAFIWPRLVNGGFVVFDDYGFSTCPGARKAVDEFFRLRSCVPLCLPTGQALVFKSHSSA